MLKCDGYGKEFKKRVISPVVVPVVEGKVEIWRIRCQRLELGMG